MRIFQSIKFVLFSAFLAIAVLGLVVFTLLATPRVKKAAVNQISSELTKQMMLVRGGFADLLKESRGVSDIQARAVSASGLSKSRVTVISKDGIVLGDSATPLASLRELENHGTRPEVVRAAAAGFGRSTRYSTTTGKELIYVAVPLTGNDGQLAGFLRFSVPTTYASELAGKIQKSVAAGLFFAAALAVVLSMLFSLTFARPLVRLSDITRKIAEGEFPQSIVRKSRFEIGELERNIEEMSKRLSETFNGLSEERNRAFAIVSSMAEGVLALDGGGRVVLANPVIEKLFNVMEPEIIGKTYREVVRNNEISDLLERTMREKKKVEKQIQVVTPIEAVFEAYAAPVEGDRGELLGAVCVLHDITELKKLERHRSEFIANVSHELKTPLTSIRSLVETLIGGAIDEKKRAAEFLGKINRGALSLSSLIDDILELSRLESKKELGAFKDVDLKKVLDRAVDLVSDKARDKKITMKLECTGGDAKISAIEEHVYRAVSNLLNNAVSYTPEGGLVKIKCQRLKGSLRVAVEDNGIGIPAEDIPRIFERFYRVDRARSRDLGGTGLGLSIVKHVMNVHNGSVSVESVPGQGSTFTLIFPA